MKIRCKDCNVYFKSEDSADFDKHVDHEWEFPARR